MFCVVKFKSVRYVLIVLLAVVFRGQIQNLLNNLFNTINNTANNAVKPQ